MSNDSNTKNDKILIEAFAGDYLIIIWIFVVIFLIIIMFGKNFLPAYISSSISNLVGIISGIILFMVSAVNIKHGFTVKFSPKFATKTAMFRWYGVFNKKTMANGLLIDKRGRDATVISIVYIFIAIGLIIFGLLHR